MPTKDDPFSANFEPEAVEEVHKNFYGVTVENKDVATKLATKLGRNVEIYASPKKIYEVVISTYYDIARYKQFHLQDPRHQKSDAVKRAAYFTKWILRRQPLVVVDRENVGQETPHSDPLALLNEDLAIQWSLICIGKEFGQTRMFLRKRFHSDLIYHLRMRELSTDALLLAYELLHKSAALPSDSNPFMEYQLSA